MLQKWMMFCEFKLSKHWHGSCYLDVEHSVCLNLFFKVLFFYIYVQWKQDCSIVVLDIVVFLEYALILFRFEVPIGISHLMSFLDVWGLRIIVLESNSYYWLIKFYKVLFQNKSKNTSCHSWSVSHQHRIHEKVFIPSFYMYYFIFMIVCMHIYNLIFHII